MNGKDIKYTSSPARLMSTLIPLLFIFLPLTSADAQVWRLQNSGTTVKLNKIFFVDTLRGWAVGERGTILNTTDGGTQWTRQQSPDTNATYNSLFIIDSLIGWAVGFRIIVRTINGGRSWKDVELPSRRTFHDIIYSSVDTGWIVGGSSVGGIILRTIDGGTTWTILRDSTAGGSFRAVHFVSNEIGWLVGGYFFDNFDPSVIVHTADAGDSWKMQTTVVLGGLRDVSFFNSQLGWAVGGYNSSYTMVIKTTNGGLSWFISGPWHNIGDTYDVYLTLESIDSTLVLVGSADERAPFIYRSTDGGDPFTWTRDSVENASPVFCIYCIDANHCWACGESGRIWRFDPVILDVQLPPVHPDKDIEISISPSPQRDYAYITYRLKKPASVKTSVFNLLGSKLHTTASTWYPEGTHTFTIDLTGFAKGVYILRTNTADKVYINKLIISE